MVLGPRNFVCNQSAQVDIGGDPAETNGRISRCHERELWLSALFWAAFAANRPHCYSYLLLPPTAVLFVSKCKFCVMNIALRSGMVHYTLTDFGISRISRIVFGSCRTHLVVKEIYMPIIFSDI